MISGPKSYRDFRETGPWTCNLEAPRVWVSLWSLAGFVLRSPQLKSSATLVNSAAWFASYQLWFFKPCYLSFQFIIIIILLFDSLPLKSPIRQGDDNYVFIYLLFIFQENGAPLSEKVFSSLTSLVSFRGKKSGNEGMNQEPGNELEMVNGASKADKAVVEDGYQDDTSTFHKMEKIANAIDKASRFLFPFIFICFNIFYWTYY